MAIKLAFSTVACPDWTLDQVIDQAKAFGYDGVELRTLGEGATELACDPAQSDPAKVAAKFNDAGVEPVCLSTSVSLHPRSDSDAFAAQRQALKAMDLAAALGCRYIRLFVNAIEPGENKEHVMNRVARRLPVLADRAVALNLQVLFENAGSFSIAKPWWWLLNQVDHPMIGLAWNVANAAAAGEGPAVSVPQLNTRIRLVKVKDTKLGEGVGFVPLGDGSVEVQHFIRRLLGIGYDGYISVEWDRLWLPTLTPAEEYLPDALKRVRAWLDEIAKAIEDAKPKAKPKPAAAAAR